MKIQLNGTSTEIAASNIKVLIEELEIPAPAALVEHNQKALLRSEWDSTVLSEGDQIEILRISAGG